MSNIIAQPCPGTQAHARMDRQGASGRANFSGNMGFRRLRSMQRHSDRDTRLARASTDDMEMALAFLSAVDPEAFEIAFMVVEGDPASSSESAAALVETATIAAAGSCHMCR